MEKKKLVVFTGAGVSADSGIATFRDADGLWANYRIEDVCTPEALARNREQVIGFYNMRRRELLASKPNAGHYALAGLEDVFDVRVITQNMTTFTKGRAAGRCFICTESCANCAVRSTNDSSFPSKVGNKNLTTVRRTVRLHGLSSSFSGRPSPISSELRKLRRRPT